jgi:hypothetical protein
MSNTPSRSYGRKERAKRRGLAGETAAVSSSPPRPRKDPIPLSDYVIKKLEELSAEQRRMLSIAFPSGSVLTAVIADDQVNPGHGSALYVIDDGPGSAPTMIDVLGEITDVEEMPEGESLVFSRDWLSFQLMF